jgi:hypothetical protein
MKIANKLSRIELPDWTGHTERLGSLWSERPIVLVFIRHFG